MPLARIDWPLRVMMANPVNVISACIAWFYLLVSLPCLSKKEVLSFAEEELSNCPFNHKLREVLAQTSFQSQTSRSAYSYTVLKMLNVLTLQS